MLSTYHYRTVDDRDRGQSTSGRRARDDAARIARETGQIVELVTPAETWRVERISATRARWTRIEQRSAAA